MSERFMITRCVTLDYLKAPSEFNVFIEILLEHREYEVTIYINSSHTK